MNNSNSNNIIKKIVKGVFWTIIIIALLLVICSINDPEFIEEMIKEYQVYIATFVWVIANVIQGILISNKCIYNGGLKRIEIAKKRNHVVYAKYLSSRMHSKDSNETVYYEYYVNGKKYLKVFSKHAGIIEDTIELYYVNKPSRAKSYSEMLFWDRAVLPFFVPILCMLLSYYLLEGFKL